MTRATPKANEWWMAKIFDCGEYGYFPTIEKVKIITVGDDFAIVFDYLRYHKVNFKDLYGKCDV